jgi:predicted transposase YdaD
MLIGRAKQELSQLPEQQGIIEMVSKIMVYKFTNSSREEIAAMLGTNVEDIRALREAKEEERQTIALNFLRQGLPVEAIAQGTGLTIVQVQALQAQVEQN